MKSCVNYVSIKVLPENNNKRKPSQYNKYAWSLKEETRLYMKRNVILPSMLERVNS